MFCLTAPRTSSQQGELVELCKALAAKKLPKKLSKKLPSSKLAGRKKSTGRTWAKGSDQAGLLISRSILIR
jgi:hypothetical protein